MGAKEWTLEDQVFFTSMSLLMGGEPGSALKACLARANFQETDMPARLKEQGPRYGSSLATGILVYPSKPCAFILLVAVATISPPSAFDSAATSPTSGCKSIPTDLEDVVVSPGCPPNSLSAWYQLNNQCSGDNDTELIIACRASKSSVKDKLRDLLGGAAKTRFQAAASSKNNKTPKKEREHRSRHPPHAPFDLIDASTFCHWWLETQRGPTLLATELVGVHGEGGQADRPGGQITVFCCPAGLTPCLPDQRSSRPWGKTAVWVGQ
ncbi:hypothetical protein NL676_036913 [Syzygium grande]|nr:hypothetical protein NL676_036913 [Syzygium grande]